MAPLNPFLLVGASSFKCSFTSSSTKLEELEKAHFESKEGEASFEKRMRKEKVMSEEPSNGVLKGRLKQSLLDAINLNKRTVIYALLLLLGTQD